MQRLEPALDIHELGGGAGTTLHRLRLQLLHRHCRRHLLIQKQLHALHPRVAVHALHHDVLIQIVGEGHEDHALMV